MDLEKEIQVGTVRQSTGQFSSHTHQQSQSQSQKQRHHSSLQQSHHHSHHTHHYTLPHYHHTHHLHLHNNTYAGSDDETRKRNDISFSMFRNMLSLKPEREESSPSPQQISSPSQKQLNNNNNNNNEPQLDLQEEQNNYEDQYHQKSQQLTQSQRRIQQPDYQEQQQPQQHHLIQEQLQQHQHHIRLNESPAPLQKMDSNSRLSASNPIHQNKSTLTLGTSKQQHSRSAERHAVLGRQLSEQSSLAHDILLYFLIECMIIISDIVFYVDLRISSQLTDSYDDLILSSSVFSSLSILLIIAVFLHQIYSSGKLMKFFVNLGQKSYKKYTIFMAIYLLIQAVLRTEVVLQYRNIRLNTLILTVLAYGMLFKWMPSTLTKYLTAIILVYFQVRFMYIEHAYLYSYFASGSVLVVYILAALILSPHMANVKQNVASQLQQQTADAATAGMGGGTSSMGITGRMLQPEKQKIRSHSQKFVSSYFKEFYHNIVSMMPQGIMIFDESENLFYVNKTTKKILSCHSYNEIVDTLKKLIVKDPKSTSSLLNNQQDNNNNNNTNSINNNNNNFFEDYTRSFRTIRTLKSLKSLKSAAVKRQPQPPPQQQQQHQQITQSGQQQSVQQQQSGGVIQGNANGNNGLTSNFDSESFSSVYYYNNNYNNNNNNNNNNHSNNEFHMISPQQVHSRNQQNVIKPVKGARRQSTRKETFPSQNNPQSITPADRPDKSPPFSNNNSNNFTSNMMMKQVASFNYLQQFSVIDAQNNSKLPSTNPSSLVQGISSKVDGLEQYETSNIHIQQLNQQPQQQQQQHPQSHQAIEQNINSITPQSYYHQPMNNHYDQQQQHQQPIKIKKSSKPSPFKYINCAAGQTQKKFENMSIMDIISILLKECALMRSSSQLDDIQKNESIKAHFKSDPIDASIGTPRNANRNMQSLSANKFRESCEVSLGGGSIEQSLAMNAQIPPSVHGGGATGFSENQRKSSHIQQYRETRVSTLQLNQQQLQQSQYGAAGMTQMSGSQRSIIRNEGTSSSRMHSVGAAWGGSGSSHNNAQQRKTSSMTGVGSNSLRNHSEITQNSLQIRIEVQGRLIEITFVQCEAEPPPVKIKQGSARKSSNQQNSQQQQQQQHQSQQHLNNQQQSNQLNSQQLLDTSKKDNSVFMQSVYNQNGLLSNNVSKLRGENHNEENEDKENDQEHERSNSMAMVLVFMEDVTTEIYMQRLEELNNYKMKMLSSVSHELKTPLNCSMGMLDQVSQYVSSDDFLMKQQSGDVAGISENIRKLIEPAQQSNLLLLSMIRDLLDLGTVELKGEIKYNFTRFNLKTLLEERCKLMRTQGKLKKIDISLIFDSFADELIVSDENRVGQIIINFLSNSLKFTSKQGKIMVKVEQYQSQHVKISVEDNGMGIPSKKIGDLFTIFGLNNMTFQRRNATEGIGTVLFQQEDQIIQKFAKNIKGIGLQVSFRLAQGLTLEEYFEKPIQVKSEEKKSTVFSFILRNQDANLVQETHKVDESEDEMDKESSRESNEQNEDNENNRGFDKYDWIHNEERSIMRSNSRRTVQENIPEEFEPENDEDKEDRYRSVQRRTHIPTIHKLSHYYKERYPAFIQEEEEADENIRIDDISIDGDNRIGTSQKEIQAIQSSVDSRVHLCDRQVGGDLEELEYLSRKSPWITSPYIAGSQISQQYMLMNPVSSNFISLANPQNNVSDHGNSFTATTMATGPPPVNNRIKGNGVIPIENNSVINKVQQAGTTAAVGSSTGLITLGGNDDTILNKSNNMITHLPIGSSIAELADELTQDLSEIDGEILIVDDVEFNLLTLQSLLKKYKMRLNLAHDGQEAIDKVKQKFKKTAAVYKIIFMDIQMPVKDGFQATKDIRRFLTSHDLPVVPIVATSAFADNSYKEHATKVGMTDYMEKPLKITQLDKIFAKYVNKH